MTHLLKAFNFDHIETQATLHEHQRYVIQNLPAPEKHQLPE